MSYMIIQYFEVKGNPFSTDWQPRCSSSTKWPRYQVLQFLGCELQWRPQSKTVSQDTQGQIPITVPWQPIDQFLELRCRPSFAVKKAEKPALDGFMVSQWKPLSWWHFNRIHSQHTMQLTFTCSLFFIHTPKFVDEVWAREEHEVSSFMPKQPKPTVIPYNCLPQNHRSIGQSKEVLLATANRLKKPGSSIRSSAVMLSFPSGALFTITSCIRHDPTWFDMIRHDLTWSDTGKSSASLCKAQHLQIIMNHCESLWIIKIPYNSMASAWCWASWQRATCSNLRLVSPRLRSPRFFCHGTCNSFSCATRIAARPAKWSSGRIWKSWHKSADTVSGRFLFKLSVHRAPSYASDILTQIQSVYPERLVRILWRRPCSAHRQMQCINCNSSRAHRSVCVVLFCKSLRLQ